MRNEGAQSAWMKQRIERTRRESRVFRYASVCALYFVHQRDAEDGRRRSMMTQCTSFREAAMLAMVFQQLDQLSVLHEKLFSDEM